MERETLELTPPVETFKQTALQDYSAKVTKKREKQIVVNKIEESDGSTPEILANSRTIPGIMTMRGCAYAGCKGVVLGPTRDILQITHGPIGCGFYSWLTRRNKTKPESPDDPNYLTYALSTDLQEDNIIFGGEKKLRAAIEEAIPIFHPKAIGIFATCPVGLIGDDIHRVARDMEEAHPEINVFAFSCEGYKGVSQSAGHHIANNKLFTDVVGQSTEPVEGKFRFNILGEYNIGGDAFEIERISKKMGLSLHTTLSGNSTYESFTNAQMVDLNVVMCHRSINYLAEMMETKYGIPWFKINFIGAEPTAKTFRKIARFFGDAELEKQVESVIAEEMAEVEKVRKEVYDHCHGLKTALFVGGSRAHHYQSLFKEIGMEVIAAGYEFAHRDDYEGRRVIPDILIDADSRNIEQIDVKADPEQFKPRKSPEEMQKMKAEGMTFEDYDGMMAEMKNRALLIDDINHHEMELLINTYHPDLICAGIKEKYVVQKQGIPFKQLHSYDYRGPYAGFKGAINFYRDIDQLVHTNAFHLGKAPWEETPELSGSFVYDGR